MSSTSNKEGEMYGLINKAIKSLVETKYGESKWEELKLHAGIKVDFFISIEQYPDEITYKLAASAPDVFGISADEFLEEVGQYWILYVRQQEYRALFDIAGDNFIEFMENLNNLHSRVNVIMPNIKPPSFKITNKKSNSAMLHYYSERDGLSALAIGLIKGLANYFNLDLRIKQLKHKSNGEKCDIFQLNFSSQNQVG